MSLPQPFVSAPPGALCAVHTERSAVSVCHRCGNYTCTDCFYVAPHDQQRYCRSCLTYVRPPLAERSTRLAAVIVDNLVVFGPALVCGIVSGVLVAVGEPSNKDWIVGTAFIVGALAVLGAVVGQLYLLATTGQSVGKRMMGIKVVRTDGSPVNLSRLIVLRNLVPWLIDLPVGGLFNLVDTLVIFTGPRRCVHDYIADTQVVIVPKPE